MPPCKQTDYFAPFGKANVEPKKRKPRGNELVALAALQRREHESICFEPYPGESPDFLLEQSIGIEVQGLVEQILMADRSPADPQRLHAVSDAFRKMIEKFGKATRGPGWHLLLRYDQEADLKDKICIRAIRTSLDKFLENPEARTVFRHSNLQVDAVCSDDSLLEQFSCEDADTLFDNDFLYPSLRENILRCIEEKSEKVNAAITRHGASYKEWWLVLVDEISFGNFEMAKVFPIPLSNSQRFKRVVIISSLYPEMWEEVPLGPT